MKAKKINMKLWFIGIICLAVILPVTWFLVVRLEARPPTLELDLVSPYIGKSQELTLSISDSQSGVRSLWVGVGVQRW